MITPQHITGIILAGGKSSRMGTDKGFLKYNGKTFVQYSIDALHPLVSEILIVSDHTAYDSLGYKRITDIVKTAGPISGICSGLQASKTAYNLILSCDIPLISTTLLEQLIQAQDGNYDIVQAESDGKSMPLIALYKTHVKTIFRNLLQTGERRLRIAVKACTHKNMVLDPAHKNATANMNTKDDLKYIQDAYND